MLIDLFLIFVNHLLPITYYVVYQQKPNFVFLNVISLLVALFYIVIAFMVFYLLFYKE
jgi:hypothetical protein